MAPAIHLHIHGPAETLPPPAFPPALAGEASSFEVGIGDSPPPWPHDVRGDETPAKPTADGIMARIEEAIARLKARGISGVALADAVGKIVHSPALALVVRLTPNPVDDAVLEILKGLFPA